MAIMALSNDVVLELAASLLAASDSAARAGLIASAVVQIVPDCACIVHRLLREDGGAALAAIGLAGSVSVAENTLSPQSRLLASVFRDPSETHFYAGNAIRREDYGHLNVSRSVASLSYLALIGREQNQHQTGIIGVIELLAFTDTAGPADLSALTPILRIAGPAILAAEDAGLRSQNLLDSVHRMSQLYDLEKSLNATLEMDEVTAMAPEKTVAMLGCQAVHLWLFDGDQLRLMSSSGKDATVEPGMIQAAGEGYTADMAEEGEALLIAEAGDERLVRRNASLGDPPATPPVTTALLVPLMHDDAEIGVLEAVNKAGGLPFDDDDQFFLSTMAETVANALKNSSLMHAERKLEILRTLVHVSSEITSTLQLDRLLQIIVNSPQSVLPFERCAIALDNRGNLQLKAVSGQSSLPLGDARVDRLIELMRWLSAQPAVLHLRSPRETSAHLPQAVARHFEATGYRALYSLPLTDEQGRVGLLIYESSDPDFLNLPYTEMIKVLAGQATVAIRNALLYREVPLISLLEPLLHKKRALFHTSRGRRLALAALAAALAFFLLFCPLPMRISGQAVIAPQHLVNVAAPVDGNIAMVYAHEGQRVAAGELLGAMTDWPWRTELASAEARYQASELAMEDSLAHGSAQAGADRAQAEFLRSEVARARGRLESARLLSPIAGIVTTPALQNTAGEHLEAGAIFAQVLDLSSAVVDIAVDQGDIALVRRGQPTSIKLDSYPQRSWHGAVDVISPQAQPGDGERTFAARVPLPNDEAVLRAGMTGRAKIFIGYRSAGFVLLRKPSLWLWQTLWNWIGW
jgi:multidrug resistance efflux pump/transcriptional regulator with GAF, ATPase, and Fis domain